MIRLLNRTMLAGFVLTLLGGCIGAKSTWMYPASSTDNLAETPEEHRQRVARILERDRQALNEDLDLLFQTDRPTRLTHWKAR